MNKDWLHDPYVSKAVAFIAALVPAFAGALTSLGFIGKLSPAGRLFAFFVGLFAAVCLAPALTDTLRHFWPPMPSTFANAITYLTALSAMAVLPKLIKWFETVAGNPTGLLLKIIQPAIPPTAKDGESGQ